VKELGGGGGSLELREDEDEKGGGGIGDCEKEWVSTAVAYWRIMGQRERWWKD
jgi:hypothetical protein